MAEKLRDAIEAFDRNLKKLERKAADSAEASRRNLEEYRNASDWERLKMGFGIKSSRKGRSVKSSENKPTSQPQNYRLPVHVNDNKQVVERPRETGFVESLINVVGTALEEAVGGAARGLEDFETAVEAVQTQNLPETELRVALRAAERELERSTTGRPTFSTSVVRLAGYTLHLGLLPAEQVHQLRDVLEIRLEAMESALAIVPQQPQMTTAERLIQENKEKLDVLKAKSAGIQEVLAERDRALAQIDASTDRQQYNLVKNLYDAHLRDVMDL